jgi:hypothetical protein
MSRNLIPDGQVARDRYHRSVRTLDRWDRDPCLGFPAPIRIRGRKYRDEAELDAFDARQAQRDGAKTEAA